MSMLGLQGSFLILDILSLAQDTLPFAGRNSGDLGYSVIAICKAQQQWGKYTNSGNDRVITYPIAFSELYYANVISSDNCETFVYGISNININYRLCNGYNDDRWNGTQTSRLFAVGR